MKKRLLALLMALMLAVPGLAAADLEAGANGSEVISLQAWLSAYGYYSGSLDGDYDDDVVSAVRAFQSRNGLSATGTATQATISLLESGNGVTVRGQTLNSENQSATGGTTTGGTTTGGGTTGGSTAVSTSTLEYGMTGSAVEELQRLLYQYGYYTGNIDGIFGSGVLSAVKQFQRRNGLTVDGKAGSRTMAVLTSGNAIAKDAPTSSTTTLQSGSSGEAVKELQRQLRETYYYAGTIDGIYGADVTRAVKWFQASAGLTVDGKAGAVTQAALYNRTAKIFNGGIPVRNLASGDRGYDVYVLQQKLASLNYLSITPSGYYGSDTVAAVKAFQQANGLNADGKAGAIVRRYLWPTIVNNQEEEDNNNQGTVDDPYTERSLRLGSYGNDVANAQMRLKAAGYLLGNADGIFGAKTKAAVIALQKDYNLKQDGIIGSQTWAVIKTLNVSNAEPDVVDPSQPSVGANVTKLQRGSKGAAVKKLQQQLITLNYLSAGEDDGKFGPKTAKALMQFQRDQKITVDGVAGSQTFVRLNEVLGVQWDVPVG